MDASKIKNVELQSMILKLEKELKEVNMSKIVEVLNKYAACRMHDYSWTNSLLIYIQGGTQCGSIATWKKLNREVIDRDKGLWITRPVFSSHEVTSTNAEGKVERKVKRGIYFMDCKTYDISNTRQTREAEPIEFNTSTAFDKLSLTSLIEVMGQHYDKLKISFEYMEPLRGGYTDGKKIVLNTERSQRDQINTLIHEFAHSQLHFGKQCYPSVIMECEAELVNYFVNKEFSENPEEFALVYLKSWGYHNVKGVVRYMDCWRIATRVVQMITSTLKKDSV